MYSIYVYLYHFNRTFHTSSHLCPFPLFLSISRLYSYFVPSAKAVESVDFLFLSSLTVVGSAERHAAVFQLDDSFGSLAGHIVNGVLVAQPVRSLDSVVHVPLPVVVLHVAQSGVNAALGGDCVRPRRKQFGDHRGFETFSYEAIGRSKTGTTGSHHHRVVRVVHQRVLLGDRIGDLRCSTVRRVV